MEIWVLIFFTILVQFSNCGSWTVGCYEKYFRHSMKNGRSFVFRRHIIFYSIICFRKVLSFCILFHLQNFYFLIYYIPFCQLHMFHSIEWQDVSYELGRIRRKLSWSTLRYSLSICMKKSKPWVLWTRFRTANNCNPMISYLHSREYWLPFRKKGNGSWNSVWRFKCKVMGHVNDAVKVEKNRRHVNDEHTRRVGTERFT